MQMILCKKTRSHQWGYQFRQAKSIMQYVQGEWFSSCGAPLSVQSFQDLRAALGKYFYSPGIPAAGALWECIVRRKLKQTRVIQGPVFSRIILTHQSFLEYLPHNVLFSISVSNSLALILLAPSVQQDEELSAISEELPLYRGSHILPSK